MALVKRRVREVMRRESGRAAAERGAAGAGRHEVAPCGGRGVRPKKKGRAAEATRPVVAMRLRRRRAAERDGLVDEVVGDVGAGERDDALRQEVQQLVVAPERCGPSVCVPVGLGRFPVTRPPAGTSDCGGDRTIDQWRTSVARSRGTARMGRGESGESGTPSR